MVKVDLITGFLGSGKTTFIKKYARYLMDQGYNIGILENDFGAVNVDMMLLQDLMGDHCELEMVSGRSDALEPSWSLMLRSQWKFQHRHRQAAEDMRLIHSWSSDQEQNR